MALMTTPRAQANFVRAAGALIGLAIALALLVAARPGEAGPGLPASVRFDVSPPGELALAPAPPSPALVADSLRPGGQRRAAAFELQNQSGRAMAVSLRGEPDSRSLDGLLRIRLSVGRRVLADTTLQGLRKGSGSVVSLRPGQARRFELRTWIPANVTTGYEGRLVTVHLIPAISYRGPG
jgi:hypothetical protein